MFMLVPLVLFHGSLGPTVFICRDFIYNMYNFGDFIRLLMIFFIFIFNVQHTCNIFYTDKTLEYKFCITYSQYNPILVHNQEQHRIDCKRSLGWYWIHIQQTRYIITNKRISQWLGVPFSTRCPRFNPWVLSLVCTRGLLPRVYWCSLCVSRFVKGKSIMDASTQMT